MFAVTCTQISAWKPGLFVNKRMETWTLLSGNKGSGFLSGFYTIYMYIKMYKMYMYMY